jgi:hypothetical protein
MLNHGIWPVLNTLEAAIRICSGFCVALGGKSRRRKIELNAMVTPEMQL